MEEEKKEKKEKKEKEVKEEGEVKKEKGEEEGEVVCSWFDASLILKIIADLIG